ncbi:MAG: hypothetical protein J0M00_02620 [Burkholderiales bacterium]|nr:hypothetical protein [Burkholderiales bacterium]
MTDVMARTDRDRVTVDLRGAGQLVHQRAAAQGMTVAAFARRALLVAAGNVPEPWEPRVPGGSPEPGLIKVTVRMPMAHALLLARRARAADVSQGSYLAGLIDGTPVLTSPDRREAIAALVRSTDQLAIICTDLNAFMRLLRIGARAELEPYRARIASLAIDVHGHLDVAGRFLTDVSRSSLTRSMSSPKGKRR